MITEEEERRLRGYIQRISGGDMIDVEFETSKEFMVKVRTRTGVDKIAGAFRGSVSEIEQNYNGEGWKVYVFE